tara:strand:+ start:14279 stop:14974 length:696 start_codon:yes stop_codon:yes gene_type:complete
MTVAEMHIQFKVGLDKTDSLNYPNFEPEEIDLWLNRAQNRFVKTRYSHDIKQETFEETQKRTDDLREVVVETTIFPSAVQTPVKPNGTLFDLPIGNNDLPIYWFAINEECGIQYLNCTNGMVTERKNVKPIQHDDYNKIQTDPFNKPNKGKIVRLMHGDTVELISDGTFVIGSYILRYIKQPETISLANNNDCELAFHTHEEIVDSAVTMALENIASPRFQSHMVESISRE